MVFQLNTDKFKLIGGDAGLDFVNTVSGRISNPNKRNNRDYFDYFRRDKLEDYEDLLAWSLKAELIEMVDAERLLGLAKKKTREAEKVLKRAHALRESVYRLIKSLIEGWKPEPDDLEKLNQELSIAREHRRFSAAESGFVFEWTNRENALDSMLWQVAESAVETLLNTDLSRIRQCGGEDCNWMFLDKSRNRSRQWCDMKDCGNLAKVRRFRKKINSDE